MLFYFLIRLKYAHLPSRLMRLNLAAGQYFHSFMNLFIKSYDLSNVGGNDVNFVSALDACTLFGEFFIGLISQGT